MAAKRRRAAGKGRRAKGYKLLIGALRVKPLKQSAVSKARRKLVRVLRAARGSKGPLGAKIEHTIDELIAESSSHFRARYDPPSMKEPESFQSEDLLVALAKRNGPEGALGAAGLIALRKTKDYDDGLSRDRYFPLGLASYAQMIHLKSERLLSFARNLRDANFESALDTALDLINYASFLADWQKREELASKGKESPL